MLELSIELYCDGTSARAFAKRRGLRKNKHIDTGYPWLQERIALKHLKLFSVSTVDNPADLFTNSLAKPVLDKSLLSCIKSANEPSPLWG